VPETSAFQPLLDRTGTELADTRVCEDECIARYIVCWVSTADPWNAFGIIHQLW